MIYVSCRHFLSRFEQRVTVMPDLAAELRQVHMIPIIGYCVLGVLILLGLIMIAWFPLATLCCGRRFDKAEKTHGNMQPTTSPPSVTDVQDSEIPLMFKDPKRKDVEMQQPQQVQYNFDKDAERFS